VEVTEGDLSIVGQQHVMNITNFTERAYFRLQLSPP